MKVFYKRFSAKSKIGQKNNRSHRSLYISLLVLLLAIMIGSFYVGRFTGIRVFEAPQILLSKIFPWIKQTWSDTAEAVVLNLRLPRIVAAVIVGASLAISGASYQSLFSNPVASSDTLGVSASAAFGAVLGILLNTNEIGIKFISFVIGCVAVVFVFLFATKISKGRNLTVYLILIGMVISSLFQAFLSLLKYIADPEDQLPKITYWLMGSFSNISLDDLPYCFACFLLGIIPLLLLRWRLNLLSVSDYEAKSMGENINILRLITVVCATLLTSSAVAMTGGISWIGLVIPHITRMLVGNDTKHLLPMSALIGGIFLLIVDNLARSLTVYELPISVLTSLIGAPIFFAILIRNKEKIVRGD